MLKIPPAAQVIKNVPATVLKSPAKSMRQMALLPTSASAYASPHRAFVIIDVIHDVSAASHINVSVSDWLIVVDVSAAPPDVYPVPDTSFALYGATPYAVSVLNAGVIELVNRASLCVSRSRSRAS